MGSATASGMRSTLQVCAVLACLAMLPAAPIVAQRASGGSVVVATDHWSYEYIRLLRERGYLGRLNPLVQPYRAADVAAALAEIDPDTVRQPVKGWVELLLEEYGWRNGAPGAKDVRWGAMLAAGARASTSLRLDPLRPTGDAKAWPRWQGGAWVESGPVAAEARLLGDMYYNDDPDGIDPGQRRGGRSDLAYVSADFPVASVVLGRLARNWFLPGTGGMMVSDVATPYPQIGLELRFWRFAVRSFTGELDTYDGHKRYFSAHRIDYQTPNFVVSFGESSLYAPQSGALSFRFLNPLEPLFFDADNQPTDDTENLMLDLQTWYRTGSLTLYGEGLLDDIDVAPEGVAEPPVYGFTLGAKLASVTPWLGLGAEYQQISAWAYRTPNVIDEYSYLRRGLGQNYSDYDRVTVSADLFPPLRGLRLTPVFQLQRQGEGNFRDSMPGGAYAGQPAVFLGVKETTYRVGLRGHYQPVRFVWVAWDAGANVIRNRDHVEGADETIFSAVGQLGVRLDFPLRRR
jgi:hypothetical protein